jgi:hypothetical protein
MLIVNCQMSEVINGAVTRNRTGDPILTMDVLYLLSYNGKIFVICDLPAGRQAHIYLQKGNDLLN